MVTPSAGAAASGTNDGTRDRGSGLRGEGGGLRAAPGRGGGLGD